PEKLKGTWIRFAYSPLCVGDKYRIGRNCEMILNSYPRELGSVLSRQIRCVHLWGFRGAQCTCTLGSTIAPSASLLQRKSGELKLYSLMSARHVKYLFP